MIEISNIVGPEVWGREDPSTILNQFDKLLVDIEEMYKNF